MGPTHVKCLFTQSREKNDRLRTYFPPQGKASLPFLEQQVIAHSKNPWSAQLSVQQKPVQHFWFLASTLSTWSLEIKCAFITQLPMKTQRSILSVADNSQRLFIMFLRGTLLPFCKFISFYGKSIKKNDTAPYLLGFCFFFFAYTSTIRTSIVSLMLLFLKCMISALHCWFKSEIKITELAENGLYGVTLQTLSTILFAFL